MITPGHIASNPRLVKEAQALAKNGYAVHLIFTQYVDYIIDFDHHILNNNPSWTYDCLDRTSKNKQIRVLNFIVTAIQKICLMLLLQGKKSNFILTHAINRYFSWQLKKAVEVKADLYIAHNLAALPVTVFAAQKNQVKCGFDAEDFHRQETTDTISSTDFKLKSTIEDAFLLQLNYLTVASPLIGKAYDQLYKMYSTCILNVFPKTKNILRSVIKQPIKLVWFSQFIGLGRGLETVFEALNQTTELNFELHLIGFLSEEMKHFLEDNSFAANIRSKIIVHPPVLPDQLIPFISQFDIGLATENSYPLNRDICLTNKIFSYIQAGLAALASDTKAQVELFLAYPGIGKIYDKNSIISFNQTLKSFYTDPELLLSCKKTAFDFGQISLNWETESVKFLKVVEETLAT